MLNNVEAALAVTPYVFVCVYLPVHCYVTLTKRCKQGHALMTRHSGSANPCPVIDFDAGFNAWMAYAYGLPKGQTVEQKFGKPFGEFLTFTDVLDTFVIDAASSVVFSCTFLLCCS